MKTATLLALLTCAAPLSAQVITPTFSGAYSFLDLGTPQNLPPSFGGCAFRIGEPDTLYIGGDANGPAGAIYRVPITRDGAGHIVSIGGPAVFHASAAYIDGGLQFGPGGVLFYACFPTNEIGMIKPGSSTTDKVVALTPLGFAGTTGALSFVPAGFPNVGRLKLASYSPGTFATATLVPDSNGTFDITAISNGTSPAGGPEGFFYVPPDSPLFVNFTSLIVCEYGPGEIATYTIDANGDPIPATRNVFMSGLGGCEGAALDPVSGDFVFSTYGGGDRILVVRGFGLPCGASSHYGQGLAGTSALIPNLGFDGCFARRQTVTFQITNGRAFAPGVFFAGLQSVSVPLFGGNLLVFPIIDIGHGLDASGNHSIVVPIPDDTYLLNTDFFTQVLYFDPGAAQSISFSDGLTMRVR